MRTRAEMVWVMAGAVAGGMLVGPFELEPAWLWGLIGGVGGGATGWGVGIIAARPWPVAARLLAGAAVVALGFGALWYVSAGEWVRNPANWEVRPQ